MPFRGLRRTFRFPLGLPVGQNEQDVDDELQFHLDLLPSCTQGGAGGPRDRPTRRM